MKSPTHPDQLRDGDFIAAADNGSKTFHLFAAPYTFVPAKVFARAMGGRRLSASQRPSTARPIGGSLRAPCRDWLEAIGAAPAVSSSNPNPNPNPTPNRRRGRP